MSNLLKKWFSLNRGVQVLIALFLGALTGIVLGPRINFLKPIGNLFINAIHMGMVPIIFTVIVCAIVSVSDMTYMRKVSMKALGMYFLSMLVAGGIAIVTALLIAPGSHFHFVAHHVDVVLKTSPTWGSMIENALPRNPVVAFANENILQIVLFSLLFGLAIKKAGKKAKVVEQFFISLSDIVFQFADLVISFAPYGVFVLVAWTFGTFGLQTIIPLFEFILTVAGACLLQMLLVYALLLKVIGRLSPVIFFKSIMPAIFLALTTSSSAATLPVSIQCAENRLGISKVLTRFLLPLGASFNLNGLSIYLTVATLFSANLFGIHLGFFDYVSVVLSVVVLAMGAAAVPGSALVVMGAVMTAAHIPLGALALIAGVDRLNDMMQTATNVTGDIFVLTLIAKQEQQMEIPSEMGLSSQKEVPTVKKVLIDKDTI